MKKGSAEKFIGKASAAHGGKYDYSKTVYKKALEKVEIICPVHGSFWMTPNNHLNGQGCPKCSSLRRNDWHKLSREEFIERASKIHGGRYDYSETEMPRSLKEKAAIICLKHGAFRQALSNHLNGAGCPECKKERLAEQRAVPEKEFLKRAEEVHGGRYDYSKAEYTDMKTKIRIICPGHGGFWQTPDAHINRHHGCPRCRTSKGEQRIESWLLEHGIRFEREKDFSGLLSDSGRSLRYDFYIPEKNLLVEYNGEQHYRPVERFGGYRKFRTQRHHDWLKRKYARDHNMALEVITPADDMPDRLTKILL